MHASTRSTQHIYALKNGEVVTRQLPAASERLSTYGLAWGAADVPLTPAYWAAQSWMWAIEEPEHFRLGRTLPEEMLACILGGYGIPAEIGLAAYDRLRATLAEDPSCLADEERVARLLSTPLWVGGRGVRYRFARQKAGYIAGAFSALPGIDEDLSDRALRDQLTRLRGFGPKTASWVVRNWRSSDDVAILDIHILRAGAHLGIFQRDWRVDRHYSLMEESYLRFAADISTKASLLDSVMWMTMRQLPRNYEVTARFRVGSSPREVPLQLGLN